MSSSLLFVLIGIFWQSGPCTSLDCPSRYPFSGNICKIRCTFAQCFRNPCILVNCRQTGDFPWFCKTLLYAFGRQKWGGGVVLYGPNEKNACFPARFRAPEVAGHITCHRSDTIEECLRILLLLQIGGPVGLWRVFWRGRICTIIRGVWGVLLSASITFTPSNQQVYRW